MKSARVVLHGALAKSVGRAEWRLAVKTPVEALQAIEVNTGKLLNHLLANWEQHYEVVVNGRSVGSVEEVAVFERSDISEIHFIPAFEGSGSGGSGLLALVGALLVVLVLVFPAIGVGIGLKAGAAVAGGGLVGATGAFAGTMLFGIGVSLLISGVAGLLAPTPDMKDEESPENRPSYIFSGATNTYRQGGPVPVGFGMLIVGSQIISAGIRAINVDLS